MDKKNFSMINRPLKRREAGKQWGDIFKVVRGKNCQPKIFSMKCPKSIVTESRLLVSRGRGMGS